MKILLYATYPTQGIGYAKIANMISNHLAAEKDIELYYFGIHNYVHQAIKERFVHPNIKFIDCIAEEAKAGFETDYGMKIIEKVLLDLKPDIFLIYNDIVVTCRLFNTLLNYRANYKHVTKFVTYIDLVYPFEKVEFINHLDRNTDLIFVFSDFWKKNLMDMGVAKNKIKVCYHGINKDLVKVEDKEKCRKFFNLEEDDFVLLNINRNSYRKAWDITLGAFIKFLIKENMNPKIKLFINCAMESRAGYDILSVIRCECIKQKVSFDEVKEHILRARNNMGHISDTEINMLYNAADVGINTCVGEGFGLCNTEHASVGKAQIISSVCAFKDIFTPEYAYMVEPRVTYYATNLLDAHNGDISICSQDDFAEAMSFYFHNRDKMEEHGKKAAEIINSRYDWTPILKKLVDDIREFME